MSVHSAMEYSLLYSLLTQGSTIYTIVVSIWNSKKDKVIEAGPEEEQQAVGLDGAPFPSSGEEALINISSGFNVASKENSFSINQNSPRLRDKIRRKSSPVKIRNFRKRNDRVSSSPHGTSEFSS